MKKNISLYGNWKMNKTPQETSNFLSEFREFFQDNSILEDCTVGLACPATNLSTAIKDIEHLNLPIAVGGQNLHTAEKGAFTGEISAQMLKASDCDFSLVGHSERRQYNQESSDIVGQKAAACFSHNLLPIICVGETKDEREKNSTNQVLEQQISAALSHISDFQNQPLTLAYEPVWAIGTGLAASPSQAQEAHKFIRDFLAHEWGDEASANATLLYGGSMNLANIAELLECPDIDGGLIGGASLQAETFAKMLQVASRMLS